MPNGVFGVSEKIGFFEKCVFSGFYAWVIMNMHSVGCLNIFVVFELFGFYLPAVRFCGTVDFAAGFDEAEPEDAAPPEE